MRYLVYKIFTEEPVKISGQNKAEEAESSLDYIPGSAVRGAVVGAYLRRRAMEEETHTGSWKRKLLKHTWFLNAYPLYREKSGTKEGTERRSLPAPWCFYGKKADLTRYNGGEISVRNILNPGENTGSAEEKVCAKEPFVFFGKDTVYGVKVRKEFRLHVSVNASENHGAGTAMFRYGVISPGQEFCGIIMTEDDSLADEIKKLISEEVYYLGGSKGSGYGQTRFSFLRETAGEMELSLDWQRDQKEFYLYYLSDGILYDEYGNLTGRLPEKFLEDALGLEKVQYAGEAGRTVSITGYNSAWRAALPQVTGIRAGTIQKYTFESCGSDLKEKIFDFQEKGIGIRRQDGYGRVLVLPGAMEQKKWARYRTGKEESFSDEETGREISEETKDQAKRILREMYRRKTSRELDRLVVETEKKTVCRLSHSQIGNLTALFQYAEYSDSRCMREKVKGYFQSFKDRKNNPYSWRQMEDTKVGERSLEKFITEVLENSDHPEQFTKQKGLEAISLAAGISYHPDAREVYIYSVTFLKKYLRYLLR